MPRSPRPPPPSRAGRFAARADGGLRRGLARLRGCRDDAAMGARAACPPRSRHGVGERAVLGRGLPRRRRLPVLGAQARLPHALPAAVSFPLRQLDHRAGARFRLGLRQGLDCLGCCWALMLVMFAVGVMNVVWMAALGLIMAIEKMSATARFSRAVGVAFLVRSAPCSWSVVVVAIGSGRGELCKRSRGSMTPGLILPRGPFRKLSEVRPKGVSRGGVHSVEGVARVGAVDAQGRLRDVVQLRRCSVRA